MGFSNLIGNEKAKRELKNELRLNKNSGTYLFYGSKGINKIDFAYSFAKGLVCNESEDDFCNECVTCKSIDKGSYADLEMVNPENGIIKIDRIRDTIKNATSTSYSGNKKVIIITDVNSLRVEAANAILKTIEEPVENTYFILLSSDLNILPTIKSRCIKIKFNPLTYDEVGVTKKEYEFFEGNVKDLLEYKKIEYNIDEKIDYIEISSKIEEYIENKDIAIKGDIIKCVLDFVEKKNFLNDLEKMELAESIEKVIGKERVILTEILKLFTKKIDEYEKIERLFDVYSSIRYNVNIPLILYNFFLEI